MRVLVTGAEGFVARHLLPRLADAGADVVGASLSGSIPGGFSFPVHTLDITDAEAVARVIRDVAPTHIIHLAAVSSVRQSFDDPETTEDVNVRGTRAILDAAAGRAPAPLVLLIGSGDEYGPNSGAPLQELPVADLHPVSPYGESKKAVEELVERNAAFRAMTIRTRSFPHIGPGQAGRFFLPDVATQIVRVERGEQRSVIGVGNVSAVRDFTDVRDVVRAYLLLLERGERGEVYNVCSGRAVSIRELLDKMTALSNVRVTVERDPARVRPVDIPALVGDHATLTRATGWEPEIPLAQTLADILAERREMAERGAREKNSPR